MNKEEVLIQLRDLHYNLKDFESVESTENDVQAVEYAIKKLERTAREVPVQEQFINSKIKKLYRLIIFIVIIQVLGTVINCTYTIKRLDYQEKVIKQILEVTSNI